MKADSFFRLDTTGNAVKRPVVQIVVEQGTPSVSMEIGEQRSLITDMGSRISILQPGMSRSEVTTTGIKPYGVTGEALDVKERQSLSFMLGGQEFHHSFLVCSLPTDAAGILGRLLNSPVP